MGQLCVATDSSRAYYLITSRLRRARMNFRRVVPGEAGIEDCDIVLTMRQEAGPVGGRFGNPLLVLERHASGEQVPDLAAADGVRRAIGERLPPERRSGF